MHHFGNMVKNIGSVPANASPLLAGDSLAAHSLRKLTALAAGSADPVLLTGPEGAGKHTLAKAIHAASPFANTPFIETSGACFNNDHLLARWEGTLYVRNIMDMSVPLQHRLMLWLDSDYADFVKVIATSDGHDDSDRVIAPLRNRLHRLRIPCPPVTNRKNDIAAILQQLWASDPDQLAPNFDQEAWAVAINHDWPDNYRELVTFAKKSSCLFGGLQVSTEQVVELLGRPVARRLVNNGFDLKQHLAQQEKHYLVEALLRSNGIIAAAAALAGLKRTTFLAKMKRYGLARI